MGGGVVFYLGGVQGEMWKRVVVVILPRSARGNASARCHLGCPVDTVDAPVTILFLKKIVLNTHCSHIERDCNEAVWKHKG